MMLTQKEMLEKVFQNPVPRDILWLDIENLLADLGAEISKSDSSRIMVKQNGLRALFHKSSYQKTADKGAVLSLRRFLENAGIRS